MFKLGEVEPQKAVEVFATIIKNEGIDPMKMKEYVKILMERDGER